MTDAAGSGPRLLGEFGSLLHDRIVQATLALSAVYLALYALPILGPEAMVTFSIRWAEPPLLAVALGASLWGVRRFQRPGERRFWWLIGANFALWMLGNFTLRLWESAGHVAYYRTADALFLLSFLAMLLALDQRPHLPEEWSRPGYNLSFSTAGTLLFVTGLVIYFFLIPEWFYPQTVSDNPSNAYVVVALDILLTLRLVHLAWVCGDLRWRWTYGLLAACTSLWLCTDTLEGLIEWEVLELPYGTWLDFLWYLPFVLFVFVRRWRQDVGGSVLGRSAASPPDGYRVERPDLMLTYALMFPLFHQVLEQVGLFPEPARSAQDTLVLACLLAFLLMTATQRSLLDRYNEALRSTVAGHMADENVRQTQKMEAIGRLAAGVAHDFNNLLTIVRARGHLVIQQSGDERVRANAQDIVRATERGSELTRQLLAFSRKQVLEKEVIDLAEIISGAEPMLRGITGEKIELRVETGADLDAVEGDRGQLLQVLLNLTANAADAMPNGGTLEIGTRNAVLPADASTSLEDNLDCVCLEVRDDGAGMTEEIRRRIFEPFFSGKSGGTGLGLATVYGVVKQSGGYIDVDSTPGRGTTFRVYLPAVGPARDRRAAPASPSAPCTQPATILLVEDQDLVRAAIRALLDRSGFRVLDCADGAAALETLESNGADIDLVLTDIVMPGMSGWELAREIRRRRPEIKVIYMSGLVEDPEESRHLRDPGTAFVQKPFTLDELMTQAGRLLG